MSYTGTEIFECAIVVIDELSETGTVSDSQIKEYKYRAPRLLDMWQHEMMRNADKRKTYEFSNKRIPNQLGDLSRMSVIDEHIDDVIFEATGSQAYYFEVDNEATVYIEEYIDGSWTIKSTISVPKQTTDNHFIAYKGLTNASATNDVRIRFSGSYYYRISNVCLYEYSFQADKIPDFVPWRKVTMPDDFKYASQVIDQYPMWQYENDTQCKWEGNNLYISYFYEGNVRVVYVPIPIKITDLTQTLEVDEINCISGAYYLAEHFALADQNTDLANRCKAKYKELKIESAIKQPLTLQEVIDVYESGD